MTLDQPRVTALLQSAIDELTGAGISPTPADVLLLDRYARKAISLSDNLPVALGWPVIVGNVSLHPMTFGARTWYDDVAVPLLPRKDDKASLLLLAFTLAHGRQPETFATLFTAPDIRKAVRSWGARLNVTDAELDVAVTRALGGGRTVPIESDPEAAAKQAAGDGDPNTWGPWLSLLCHYYPGQSREYWLWNASTDDILAALRDARMFRGGDFDQGDPSFQAFGVFREAVKAIKARWKPLGAPVARPETASVGKEGGPVHGE